MIYFDNNSTTPLDPRVLAKMLPYLQGKWGNPSSRDHAFGWNAHEAVEEARFQVAELIHATSNEIIFTSCATESIHLAIHGLFNQPSLAGLRLLTSSVEHEAVLEACRKLVSRGLILEQLSVDAEGQLDLNALDQSLASHPTKLVSLMAANNETGVLFPIRECAALAHAHGAWFFTDAVQALGKVPLNAQADGFDLAAFSAHKLNGPMGVGALYIRGGQKSIPLEALLSGGGQEGGLRAGTLNVAGIVGFGEACRIAQIDMATDALRLGAMRDRLENAILSLSPEIQVHANRLNRLPNTTNIRFPHIDARHFIRDMHDLAVSTRSACSSGSTEPSHVLKAMGIADGDAFSSIRFSLGRFTTDLEIDRAIQKVSASYIKLRSHANLP